jgi:hypothetical protein
MGRFHVTYRVHSLRIYLSQVATSILFARMVSVWIYCRRSVRPDSDKPSRGLEFATLSSL